MEADAIGGKHVFHSQCGHVVGRHSVLEDEEVATFLLFAHRGCRIQIIAIDGGVVFVVRLANDEDHIKRIFFVAGDHRLKDLFGCFPGSIVLVVGQVQMIKGVKQVGWCILYAIEGLALVPRLQLRLGGRKEHHDDQNRLPDTHSEPEDEMLQSVHTIHPILFIL